MILKDYFDKKVRENKVFKTWYDEKCKSEYIFYDEIYYYCKTDVDILRMGCVKFSHLMEEITRVAPFYDKSCITIASLALKIYHLNLKKEKIGQIPPTGYGSRNINQSIIALCWLNEIEEELNGLGYELYSKLHDFGEYKVCGRFVDGYCEETKTVYQFHSCFYHGCETCFDGEDCSK